jgi:serine/threonine protein phosphatase PrpC
MTDRVEMSGETDAGAREYNEDSLLISPEARFALVVDGMGGSCTGVVASRIAVAAMACCLESAPREGDEERRLLEAIQVANALIHEAALREALPASRIGRAVYERLDNTARAIHDAAADP